MRKNTLILIATTCFFIFTFSAQPSRASQTPAKLVLQIFRHTGAEPVYQQAPGGEWSAVFKRIKTANTVNLTAPVRAIQVTSSIEGDGVRVKVSALMGARFFDHEELVASFVAHGGDEITVTQLSKLGVEPFRIVVLKEAPSVYVSPPIVNKTQSIEATSQIDETKAGRIKLNLRNLSGKDVIALGVATMREQRLGATALPRAPEGQTLIAPGASYEFKIFEGGGGSVTAGSYTPPLIETALIQAVVFADGSYEGEAGIAARALAYRAGEKRQISRLIPLLKKALHDNPGANEIDAVNVLRSQAQALKDIAEQSDIESVKGRFAELRPSDDKSVQTCIEVSMHRVRKNLLDELEAFERSHPAASRQEAFRGWLIAALEKHKSWLARL